MWNSLFMESWWPLPECNLVFSNDDYFSLIYPWIYQILWQISSLVLARSFSRAMWEGLSSLELRTRKAGHGHGVSPSLSRIYTHFHTVCANKIKHPNPLFFCSVLFRFCVWNCRGLPNPTDGKVPNFSNSIYMKKRKKKNVFLKIIGKFQFIKTFK